MLQGKRWIKKGATVLFAVGLTACISSTALAAENIRLGYMKADDVNVRASASADGEVIGKIGVDDTICVTGSKGEYYQIDFNGKTGYVIDEYARTSDYQSAAITADDVALRAGASTDSKRIGSLNKGDSVYVYGNSGSFCKVTYEDKVGYVFKDFVNIGGTTTAKEDTPEKAKEAEESSKKSEEPKKETPSEMTLESIGTDAPASRKSMKLHNNDPEPSAEAQPTDILAYSLELEEIGEVIEIKENTPINRQVDPGSYTEEELYLLAQITYAEGKGQSTDGYKAIASVIYNRLQSNKFPDTVESVCYQSGQFSVIHLSGFSSSEPSERCMEAVKSVFVNGEVTLPPDIMFFKSSRLSRDWGAYRSYFATIGPNMFYS